MRRRGGAIYVSTMAISGVFILTGVALIRTQSADRALASAMASADQIDQCARSAAEYASFKSGLLVLPADWDNPPDAAAAWSIDFGETCSTAGELVRRLSIPEDEPPVHDFFRPLRLRAGARLGQHRAGYEVQLLPRMHPSLKYAVFADREIRISPETRIAANTVLRTNGYFLQELGSTWTDTVLEDPTSTHLLARPVVPTSETYNQYVNDFGAERPVYVESDWTDLESVARPDLFYVSDHWIDYPRVDSTGVVKTGLTGHRVGSLPDIAGETMINLSWPGGIESEVGQTTDLGPDYTAYWAAVESESEPFTCIRRLSLEGIYTLNANGGGVLLRSVRVKGTLIIFNVGDADDIPASWQDEAWSEDDKIKHSVTIDKNCVFEPAPADSRKLPTLVILAKAGGAQPTVRISAAADFLKGDTFDFDERHPVVLNDSPPRMQICEGAACDPYDDNLPPTDFAVGGIPTRWAGLFATDQAEVTLDSVETMTAPVVFEGTIIAGTVTLGRVRVSYPADPFVGFGEDMFKVMLNKPSLKVVPYTRRELTSAEVQNVLNPRLEDGGGAQQVEGGHKLVGPM